MTHGEVEACFRQADGTYRFARWGRPIVPVVFGVDDGTLAIVKGAIEAMAVLARHQMAETDPELGVNLMFFFVRDWSELEATPDLDRLIPNLPDLLGRLRRSDAHHYRLFRFDEAGAVKAAFVFVRVAGVVAETPAEDIALSEAAQIMLLWSDAAFQKTGPLGVANGQTLLRPDVAAIIRAAYDPVLPVAASDPSHALRLAARLDVEAG